MTRLALVITAMMVALAPKTAGAHGLAAALVEVREDAPGRATVAVKVAAADGSLDPGLDVVLPDGCRPEAPPAGAHIPGGLVETTRVACERGLRGGSVTVRFRERREDVLVRVRLADGGEVTGVVRPGAPSLALPAAGGAARLDVARGYAVLGLRHILLAPDHLLFVLGLLLLASGWGRVVATLTAFTAGHSVTLSLAALGVVRFPAAPIEAVIALSIFFLAVELTRGDGLARRRPWIFAAAFGLLHGFGFAGALAATGLPAGRIPLALFAFNLGVELGQLAFVAAAVLALRLARLRRGTFRTAAAQRSSKRGEPLRATPTGPEAPPPTPVGAEQALKWAVRPPSPESSPAPISSASRPFDLQTLLLPYAIGSLAAFWCLARIAAFLPGGAP